MYHPTSRVLAVLELLQARPAITGPELAARLETDVRTVRRYITHLQDAGIPVESGIGRYGGYRLRPGFKLPPLIFTEEEATAITLGLLANSWLAVDQSPAAIESALAKVTRVLPVQARQRLEAIAEHLVLFPQNQQERPPAALLIDLSQAIQASQCVQLVYRARRGEVTRRKVEPYGISGWRGAWYMGGYCHLRRDYRTFRLDRIQSVQVLSETFEKAADFDYETFTKEHYATNYETQIVVEFQADLATVEQKMPVCYGTLTPTPGGVLFEEQHDDLESVARHLVLLNLPFVVHQPPELRTALQRLSERVARLARNVPAGARVETKTERVVGRSSPDPSND